MRLGKITHHINAPTLFSKRYTKIVDQAGIGGRKMLLPGEISRTTSSCIEKSADTILTIGNEP